MNDQILDGGDTENNLRQLAIAVANCFYFEYSQVLGLAVKCCKYSFQKFEYLKRFTAATPACEADDVSK